jgi:hypothetical protein
MPRPVLPAVAMLAAVTLAAVTLAACGDAGSPSSDAQVNFSLATRPATSASMGIASVNTPETFTDGANTLVIDQVQLVLREIELKRVEATTACGESGGGGCEELELGPILLDLPLGGTGGAARRFSVPLAAGSYDEVELQIHTPSDDDAGDGAFVQAHPDFAGVSVKVTGTFQGQPFTYLSDLDAEEEIELSPPLVVTQAAATDLTLFVDLDRWFRDASGNLVDPESANAGNVNEQLVDDNIRGTLRAFEDENHDGADDHGGEDGPLHD